MTGDPEQHPPTPREEVPPSTRAVPLATDQPPIPLTPTAVNDVVPPGSLPVPGQCLGDFRILEVLGAGSFATVFLAEQLSLGREVALKVGTAHGSEARTLAILEHEHIVPVHSEEVDAGRGLWLLCMKFVPGTDLEHVMRELAALDPAQWSGQAILDAIDRLCRHPAMFDPAALRDRERLAGSDFIEAVAWLGARLAEALAHAHSRGVLHRDVKPANILLNRYGRPLLSDFNLALCSARDLGRDHFGGTLRYMAPEHLDAFNPATAASCDAVDQRSDIYSLGVVLFELLTGKPFLSAQRVTPALLEEMTAARREKAASPRQLRAAIPEVLDRVVRRCLEPEPEHRYQKAEELAQALEGCRELRQMERDFPQARAVTRLCLRVPVRTIIALAFLPHLLGSVVNITYNALCIVNNLSQRQQQAFTEILLVYNAVVYPFCLWVVWRWVIPIFQLLRRLGGPERVEAEEAARLRRRALGVPALSVGLSCLGWLPGGLLFPLGIDWLAEPVPAAVVGHFLVSFTIAGLIATTYSYFGIQFFVLRVLYPRLWLDPKAPRQQAQRELHPIEGRLRAFEFAAGLIPLSGAVLLVGVGPDSQFTLPFRLLVVGLIGLGMAGFGAALLVSGRLSRTLNVLLGAGTRTAGSNRPGHPS